MNPNYTEFKFPQIQAHPWPKVFTKRLPPEAVDLVRAAPEGPARPSRVQGGPCPAGSRGGPAQPALLGLPHWRPAAASRQRQAWARGHRHQAPPPPPPPGRLPTLCPAVRARPELPALCVSCCPPGGPAAGVLADAAADGA
jgi:hypothetical protein